VNFLKFFSVYNFFSFQSTTYGEGAVHGSESQWTGYCRCQNKVCFFILVVVIYVIITVRALFK
jgi:hypothetical protein